MKSKEKTWEKGLKRVLEKIGGDGWFLVMRKKEREPLVKFISKTLQKEISKALGEVKLEKTNKYYHWGLGEKLKKSGYDLADKEIKTKIQQILKKYKG